MLLCGWRRRKKNRPIETESVSPTTTNLLNPPNPQNDDDSEICINSTPNASNDVNLEENDEKRMCI